MKISMLFMGKVLSSICVASVALSILWQPALYVAISCYAAILILMIWSIS